jgi:hypothetical protein
MQVAHRDYMVTSHGEAALRESLQTHEDGELRAADAAAGMHCSRPLL